MFTKAQLVDPVSLATIVLLICTLFADKKPVRYLCLLGAFLGVAFLLFF